MKSVRSTALELATFTALAWYASAHWAGGLVADGSGGRVFACVVIASGVGAAVFLAGAAPARLRVVLRTACALAGLGSGFVAAGLDRHLLAPAHWDELGDGVDRGFAALGSVRFPYDGAEPWASLVLLLAIPLVVTTAAVLAFWGARKLRPVALVLLLALYGMAATEHQFDGELGRGILLLFLTAAWLWLPRTAERGAQRIAVAAGTVLVACLAALPAAARYQDHEPLVDYKSWNPFASQPATQFDWSHNYGPIDWPRDGTTLMNVRSDERHYWKVETLDRFDGFRWVRSGLGRGDSPLLPSPYDLVWETDFRVTIRDLDTDLFPIAGTALQIRGADPVAVPSADGTVEAAGESLDKGDSYFVEAYVPDPSPEEMRVAPSLPGSEQLYGPGYPPAYVRAEISRYTDVLLPPPGTTALARERIPGDASRSAASAPTPASTSAIAASPYGGVLRLAQRLARGQPTAYDTVRAVQSHLRSEYTYSEAPPRRGFPLSAFLFRDRIGYCQQFSGAMALMLRMLGIPARVAAGFTPGSYNTDTKEYRVRDLDAHSWVEVWFDTIGWVPFDPTPAVAPADLQASVNAASASRGPTGASEAQDTGQASPAPGSGGDSDESTGRDDPALQSWMLIAALLLAGAIGLAIPRARAALRRARRPVVEDLDVAALTRILGVAGGGVPARLTLRELERRLEEMAEPEAARYARMLRDRRFGPTSGRAPDSPARRAVRRALTRGRGPRTKLTALVAMPPALFRRG